MQLQAARGGSGIPLTVDEATARGTRPQLKAVVIAANLSSNPHGTIALAIRHHPMQWQFQSRLLLIRSVLKFSSDESYVS